MELLFQYESWYLWALGLVVLLFVIALLRRGTHRRGGTPRGIKVGDLSTDWLSKHRDWRQGR